MAVLNNINWKGEPLKAIIYFSDSLVYTVYNKKSYSDTPNFIESINFNLTEGNNNVNPLGISSSNTITIRIFDVNDYLSPANTKSPYAGKMVNGIRIDVFISYDSLTWSPYGQYYTTSWSGEFSDGYNGLVSINADDKLNTIGNMDLPELPAYSNIKIRDLISYVMAGLNISTSEYSIDSSLDDNLTYGIVAGTKVRDFFNNVCQLMFARVIIDRQGIIRFIPALRTYANYNELTIGREYTGSLSNKINSNINYNKVAVKYLEAGDTSVEQLFNDSNHVLNDGENKITDISFKFRALSIEQVSVLFESNKSHINSLTYKGYQNGMELDIDVANGPINNCQIIGYGTIVSTTDKEVSVSVADTAVIGGSTFTFDTKQMLTKTEANRILSNLQTYMSKIGRNIILQGTALTPEIYTGDKITISNTNTLYDGSYKVIALNINYGENYELSATLIRL